MEGILGLLCRILDPDPPDQKALGVDPVRRAGQQGAIVLAFDNFQIFGAVRFYVMNRVNLLSDRLV